MFYTASDKIAKSHKISTCFLKTLNFFKGWLNLNRKPIKTDWRQVFNKIFFTITILLNHEICLGLAEKSKDIFKSNYFWIASNKISSCQSCYTRVWGRRKEEKTWKEWWVITPYEQELFLGGIVTKTFIQGRFYGIFYVF